MERQDENLNEDLVGDKVRVRSGPDVGMRGIIKSVVEGKIEVQCEDVLLHLEREVITNYSLAARRAWQVMPKRSGRPTGQGFRKKMVSIRVESDLWDKLGQAVEEGLIVSREQAINEWIRKQLELLQML